MRKTLVALSLLACVTALPGAVGTAEAKNRHNRNCHHGSAGYHPGYGAGYGYGYGGGDWAWDVVRGDPCRYEEFQRFASRHKNPNKRQRFAERLAREGCGRRYGGNYGGYPPSGYGGNYGGYPPSGYPPYGYPPVGGYGYADEPYGYGDAFPGGYGGSYGYAGDPLINGVVAPLIGLMLGR